MHDSLYSQGLEKYNNAKNVAIVFSSFGLATLISGLS
jgi:hypothetical protein